MSIPGQFRVESIGSGESRVMVVIGDRAWEFMLEDIDMMAHVSRWMQTLPKESQIRLYGALQQSLEIEKRQGDGA